MLSVSIHGDDDICVELQCGAKACDRRGSYTEVRDMPQDQSASPPGGVHRVVVRAVVDHQRNDFERADAGRDMDRTAEMIGASFLAGITTTTVFTSAIGSMIGHGLNELNGFALH